VNNAHLCRPEVGSLVQTKRLGQVRGQDLDRPDPSSHPQRSLTKAPQSDLVHKEDALEAIMSVESQLGFLQMGLYQLNKLNATRVAVDPADIESVDKLDYLMDGLDFESPSEHCLDPQRDSEYLEQNELRLWSCNSQEYNEGSASPPEWFSDVEGLGIGIGFPSDPGPPAKGVDGRPPACQDRIFGARCGEFTVLGLANGHGRPRTSEALLKRIAELLPPALFQSVPFLRQDLAGALINAFHHVHCEASQELDLRLTGAAVTVALIDDHSVWVAHVGDCRAVLGVPDPHANAASFHFAPNCLTSDHTLAVSKEFDKVCDAGAECRKLVNDNVYRMYIRDQEIPGLTLTRAIGDRLAHSVGLHHTPSVAMVERHTLSQGDTGSFLVMGTGALWSVMSERTVVNWISRHFSDAMSAAESLSSEAAERWQDPECTTKRSLKAGLPESFGSILIYFKPPEAAAGSTTRSFVTGPHSVKDSHHDWDTVKHKGRADELRRTQARLLPAEELAD